MPSWSFHIIKSFFFRNTSEETSKYFPSFQGWHPVQTRFWIAEVFTLSDSKSMCHEIWTQVGMVLPIPPYQLSSNSQTSLSHYVTRNHVQLPHAICWTFREYWEGGVNQYKTILTLFNYASTIKIESNTCTQIFTWKTNLGEKHKLLFFIV